MIWRVLFFLLVLCISTASAGVNDPASLCNPTCPSPIPPVNNASFLVDLQRYLGTQNPVSTTAAGPHGEFAARYKETFALDFVYSGGVPSTSASCTVPITAMVAYTLDGNRLSAPATSVDISSIANCANPATDSCYLIASAREVASISNFTRLGSTNYYLDCTSTSFTLPADAVRVADLTIVNGAVTAVQDTSNHKPTLNSKQFGYIIIPDYATSGNGTAASPWDGWTARIKWSQTGVVYWAPAGRYNIQEINFSGTPGGAAGQSSFLGSGIITTQFIYTGSTGPVFNCTASPAETCAELELAGFYLTPTDKTIVKAAIRLTDFRSIYVHDIWVQSWRGGNDSIVLETYGRDTSTFERLILDGNRPIYIKENPRQLFTGMDTVTWRDMYIGHLDGVISGKPCIEIADKALISRFRFEGYQSWNLCSSGLYWNAPSDVSYGGDIILQNVGWEQNTDPTKWMIYINRASPIQQLIMRNMFGGGANGIYLSGIQGIAEIDNWWWACSLASCPSGQVPLYADATAGAGIGGISIKTSLWNGDVTFNPGGINPCTGAGGAPTGTHSCLKNFNKVFSVEYGVHKTSNGTTVDTSGPDAYYLSTALANQKVTIMGQSFSGAGGMVTFTPQLNDSGGHNGTTFTRAVGHWASSGSVTVLYMLVEINVLDPLLSGPVVLSPTGGYVIPQPPNLANFLQSCQIGGWHNVTPTTGRTQFGAYVPPANGSVVLTAMGPALSQVFIQAANLATGSILEVTCSYIATIPGITP
jgi:hypothetical protein